MKGTKFEKERLIIKNYENWKNSKKSWIPQSRMIFRNKKEHDIKSLQREITNLKEELKLVKERKFKIPNMSKEAYDYSVKMDIETAKNNDWEVVMEE